MKHMEANSNIFDYSNINKVCEIYALTLREAAESGELIKRFRELDEEGSGLISMRNLKGVFMEYKCSYYYGGPPEQAVITVCRKLGNKVACRYEKFVAALLDPRSLDLF